MKSVQRTESFLSDEREHQLINVAQKYKRQCRMMMVLALLLVGALVSTFTVFWVRSYGDMQIQLSAERTSVQTVQSSNDQVTDGGS